MKLFQYSIFVIAGLLSLGNANAQREPLNFTGLPNGQYLFPIIPNFKNTSCLNHLVGVYWDESDNYFFKTHYITKIANNKLSIRTIYHDSRGLVNHVFKDEEEVLQLGDVIPNDPVNSSGRHAKVFGKMRFFSEQVYCQGNKLISATLENNYDASGNGGYSIPSGTFSYRVMFVDTSPNGRPFLRSEAGSEYIYHTEYSPLVSKSNFMDGKIHGSMSIKDAVENGKLLPMDFIDKVLQDTRENLSKDEREKLPQGRFHAKILLSPNDDQEIPLYLEINLEIDAQHSPGRDTDLKQMDGRDLKELKKLFERRKQFIENAVEFYKNNTDPNAKPKPFIILIDPSNNKNQGHQDNLQ